MKAFIDELEAKLKADARLYGVKVDTYGDKYVLPEDLPYVNILPRAKRRERSYVIGAQILYNVNPEVEIQCWEVSAESTRDAFDKCEALATKVLDCLADISASDLNVNSHESEIESFDGGEYQASYYYTGSILLKAGKEESYT